MILIALLSALPVFSAYSLCSTSDVKGPITIPIQMVLVTSPITATGSIVIVDGCQVSLLISPKFDVSGFSLANAGTSRWYGGIGSSLDAVTLSEDVINPNPPGGKQSFTFRSVAGAAVSFKDFNQFRLFDTSTNTLIAIANVPSNILATGPVTATSGTMVETRTPITVTSSRTTSVPVAQPEPNGSPIFVHTVTGILAALMLLLGL